MRQSMFALSISVFLFICSVPVQAALPFYVDADVNKPLEEQNGRTWGTAYKDLQDAIDTMPAGFEIWVKEGTYYPSETVDRNASFQMRNGVEIYGGFNGSETQRNQRDILAHPTILSGDLDKSGTLNDGDAYHVFYHPVGLALDETAVLNGFTITGGNADGTAPHDSGGGMYNSYSSPTLSNCVFKDNSAVGAGGGIYNDEVISQTIFNCVFRGNEALNGGGMGNHASSPTIINGSFKANHALNSGGGIHNNASTPTLTNCILWGNTADSSGPDITNETGVPDIAYSDVRYSGGSGVGWDNNFGNDKGGNIDSDPGFESDGSVHLSPGSPCIDKGDSSAVTDPNALDMDGEARNTGSTVDMGADEFVDTDEDRLSDWAEVYIHNTEPDNMDSDDDELADGVETLDLNTIPTDDDTDGDGYKDGSEIYHGTNPDDGMDPPADMPLKTFYVNADVGGGNNMGSNWANAIPNLQTAIGVSLDGEAVWVAEGTYYPSKKRGGTTERDKAFQMKNGVAIYGGFAGNESSLDQRNPETNTTILSGDLDQNGILDNGNAYHVFYNDGALGLDETAVLDGFTITGGNANGGSNSFKNGGGMYNAGGAFPTVTRCIFSKNQAENSGGGLYNSQSSPIITRCMFTGNQASSGGGIYNNTSFSMISDCFFIDNLAEYHGGGIYNGGRYKINNNYYSPTITNCTLRDNESDYGGGIYNNESSPVITNCILWNNSSITEGGQVFNKSISTLKATLSHCNIQGIESAWDFSLGTNGGGNFDADPRFTGEDNVHIMSDSPCIDKGDNNAIPAGIVTDIDGETRTFNFTGTAAPVVDIGADEYMDSDLDGLSDYEEVMIYFTYPDNTDSDGDTLLDGDEVMEYGTDPTKTDSDGDGLSDDAEINTHLTDPTNIDTDGDGVSDGDEISAGTDPTDVDADGDGIINAEDAYPQTVNGPGLPILTSPDDGATAVDLGVQLYVDYMAGAEPEYHTATRWQISTDQNFSTLAVDIQSETNLLTVTLPDLILESETLYYWRVRFDAKDRIDRLWSPVRSFTTETASANDTNANGIFDGQELGEGITPAISPAWDPDWLDECAHITFETDDGSSAQVALRLKDDESSLIFFRQIPSSDLDEASPLALPMGAFSIKIQVPEDGESTSIRLYLSPSPLAGDTVIYKFSPANGWFDYSANTMISDDYSYITVRLTDGGTGDADGVANGIIVDPLGVGIPVEEPSPGPTPGSDKDDICFISTLL